MTGWVWVLRKAPRDRPGAMTHTSNPCAQETEAGNPATKTKPNKKHLKGPNYKIPVTCGFMTQEKLILTKVQPSGPVGPPSCLSVQSVPLGD